MSGDYLVSLNERSEALPTLWWELAILLVVSLALSTLGIYRSAVLADILNLRWQEPAVEERGFH